MGVIIIPPPEVELPFIKLLINVPGLLFSGSNSPVKRSDVAETGRTSKLEILESRFLKSCCASRLLVSRSRLSFVCLEKRKRGVSSVNRKLK